MDDLGPYRTGHGKGPKWVRWRWTVENVERLLPEKHTIGFILALVLTWVTAYMHASQAGAYTYAAGITAAFFAVVGSVSLLIKHA
jgi:heme/copper-type cytochrome/quinol oxidase subunit 4